jgi:PIN domain nuclease of toxin-antitoxin system
MRRLLDTHTFIWWASEPGKLSPTALGMREDANITLYLSVGSVWEMQIKHHLASWNCVNLWTRLFKPSKRPTIYSFSQLKSIISWSFTGCRTIIVIHSTVC